MRANIEVSDSMYFHVYAAKYGQEVPDELYKQYLEVTEKWEEIQDKLEKLYDEG